MFLACGNSAACQRLTLDGNLFLPSPICKVACGRCMDAPLDIMLCSFFSEWLGKVGCVVALQPIVCFVEMRMMPGQFQIDNFFLKIERIVWRVIFRKNDETIIFNLG